MYENLVKFVSDLLQIGQEQVEEEIINLKAKEDIYLEERESKEWVYLANFYIAQKNNADKLIALDKTKNITKIQNIKVELENSTSDGREVKYELDKPVDSESTFSKYLQEYVAEDDTKVDLPDDN